MGPQESHWLFTPLLAAFLPLDFWGRIAATEVSICLISLSVVFGAPRSSVSVFVPLTVAFVALEAFLVQVEAAVAWVH